MTKAECETNIRDLFHEWRKDKGLLCTPPDKLIFENFFSWLDDNYQKFLKFRTRTSVRQDVGLWFDQEVRKARMREGK